VRWGKVLLAANLLVFATTFPALAQSQGNPLLFGQRARPQRSSATASWQQWDAFLTFVITQVGQMLPAEQRRMLADVLLDARYELADALVSPTIRADVLVPRLFVNTMQRLSPALRSGLTGLPSGQAAQISNFANAMDSMTALGEIGLRTGLVELTPTTLRGLAYIIDPGTRRDPLAYTTNVDPRLRDLLGLGTAIPVPRYDPFQQLAPPSGKKEQDTMRFRLNTWLPRRADITDYLTEVRTLLHDVASQNVETSGMSEEFRQIYTHILFATAWQESCWRQFVKRGEKLLPLTSGTGDVGLMQVNRFVWRGVYDLERLDNDIRYNSRAGSEILLNYLTRYAIRKGEHQRPGGIDNLARATYGAYNGGPRHLTRYRKQPRNPHLKRVDDLFWTKYATVKNGRELAVRDCYGF